MTFIFEYTDLTAPDSTAIDSVAFDATTGDMLVKFVDSGYYLYKDVPFSIFEPFTDTYRSAGRHYREDVSGKYTSERLGEWGVIVQPRPEPEPVEPEQTVHVGDADVSFDVPVDRIDLPKARYSIRWETADGRIGGNPEFFAASEAEALTLLNQGFESAKALGFVSDGAVIKSITRYFD